jgi:peptide methionine sulfoxide reductase msrA/msrB
MENLEKLNLTELKHKLSTEQFKVTQQNGTEQPFKNAYWNNYKPGLYVDVVSGEPLFSSLDKYDSGTGWPSFTRPVQNSGIVEKQDNEYGIARIEVRSRYADSHLGHMFSDGPEPTGRRYCINSASLRFIPVERISKEGYETYIDIFIQAELVSNSANKLE